MGKKLSKEGAQGTGDSPHTAAEGADIFLSSYPLLTLVIAQRMALLKMYQSEMNSVMSIIGH
jgi:hypothetical protein